MSMEKRDSCCFVKAEKQEKFFEWWKEKRRTRFCEGTKNLYSEIVFMCDIIISNGYVYVPYTSDRIRLHLFDFSSQLTFFADKGRKRRRKQEKSW